MYDARFRGLDEAFKKIGGEPATTIGWTSEADPDPEYNSSTAVVYDGGTGNVGNYIQVWHVRRASGFRFQEIVSQFNHSRALYGARG